MSHEIDKICIIGRVYALTRVGTVLTRVARKRRGLVPECSLDPTKHETWVYRVARWRLSKRKCYLFRNILYLLIK